MATIQLTVNVPAVAATIETITSPDGTTFTIPAGTSRVIPLAAADQFGRPVTGVAYGVGAINNAQVHATGGTDQITVAVDAAAGLDGITGLQLDVGNVA